MKRIEEMTFEELVEWSHNEHMSALFTSGGKEAKSRMYTILWCAVDQWYKAQEKLEKAAKK